MYSNDRLSVHKFVRTLQKFYAKPWQLSQLEQLEAFKQLIGPHHGALSYLRLTCIPEDRKYELVMKAIHSLQLTDILEPLLYLLKKNKQFGHLFNIIDALITEVKRQLRVEDITIYSACDLPHEDQILLEKWIKKERSANVVRSHVVIKPELIGGFRIEGNTFMGDYSIYRKLHNLQNLCVKEG